MATEKNITMKQFNGTDYDTLYPKTKLEQVKGAYTQQQILADSTKTLFGLNKNAVPDDALTTIKTLIDSNYSELSSLANSKAKIATGSYVGTGAYYGYATMSALTYITVGFTPKLFIISEIGGRTLLAIGQNIGFYTSGTYVTSFATPDTLDITTWGPTIALKGSYSAGEADGQFNALNTTYYWFAIE